MLNNAVFLLHYFVDEFASGTETSACAPPDGTLTTVSLLASSRAWPREADGRRHRTRAKGGGWKPCAEWQGRADPGGSAVGDAVAQQKVWCKNLVRPEDRIGRS